MSNKKGFLQISFGWLFAIIVGAIILFFAIYFSVQLINTQEKVSTTTAGKEITVLLNPLETGFGEETTTSLTLSVESQINNECGNSGNFGSQEISVAQKISGKWSDAGLSQRFYNKYVFSNDSVTGRDFYLFSKPFEFPFKVSDLIFLTSARDNYCFADAPDSIKQELTNLGQPNLILDNCPARRIKVCFSSAGTDCDVIVDTRQESVRNVTSGETVYYETDALMYAAIFSSKAMYECQVKRLMQRLESLALLYNDKGVILSDIGCNAESSLLGLADAAGSLEDSGDLRMVKTFETSAENENKRASASCAAW